MEEKANTIRLKLIRKKVTFGSKSFYKYLTPIYFLNDDGEYERKLVQVKFAEGVSTKDFKGMGVLRVFSEDIETPDEKYVIRDKIDRDGKKVEGKKVYPHVYIRGYVDYKESPKPKADQKRFVIDPDTEETEIE